jgi:glycosyltransferase involved in cell wall biosynthesis
MKIVLNGLPAVYPISGVGRYTIELGKALESLLGKGEIFWFGKNLSSNRFDDSDSLDSPLIRRTQYFFRKMLRKIPGWTMPIHSWRNQRFKSYIQKIRPSLYHETNYTPFSFGEGPTLINLYDLSFIRHPEWHPKDRVKHLEKYCLKQLSKANAIITISEFSKKEIIHLLNIDPTKIHITYPGVNSDFSPEGKRMERLPDRYILFLGNLEPRKNLPVLLTAYQSLPRNLRDRNSLVLAGTRAWQTNKLEKKIHLLQKDEKIILTGYVPQAMLPNLYRGASLFVYPSFYEGFGLPVLEAMASGVPVITSKTTSLPEVVGDAGVLVNPYDADELKEAMIKVLEDPKIRREMSEKGPERAKLFSWEKCAKETIEVYKKVLWNGFVP